MKEWKRFHFWPCRWQGKKTADFEREVELLPSGIAALNCKVKQTAADQWNRSSGCWQVPM
ncbi:hypothetical protein ACFOLF_26550 [Paenibacillus sepulcri]|uniref:hypothetical protein n=1 Tax=Paenibacillus sepulcri TaxID=359917 RepID=UPI001AE8FEB3